MVHPIFIGLYCYPRNVLADAKLETNFVCSPVPFGAWKGQEQSAVVCHETSREATRKWSFATKLLKTKKKWKNAQQMLEGEVEPSGRRYPHEGSLGLSNGS